MIATVAPPPSSPARSPSNIGTTLSATPPSATPSWIASFTTHTAFNSPEKACERRTPAIKLLTPPQTPEPITLSVKAAAHHRAKQLLTMRRNRRSPSAKCAAWANIDIAVLVEGEVGTAERAIGTCRFVPNRNVRCDVAIYQPFEQPDCAIDRVAHEPLGPQIKTALNTVHHGLGDSNLYCSVCSSAYGIDDDANLVVDQIVCIVGKEGIQA